MNEENIHDYIGRVFKYKGCNYYLIPISVNISDDEITYKDNIRERSISISLRSFITLVPRYYDLFTEKEALVAKIQHFG